jgi:hypothetical protein
MATFYCFGIPVASYLALRHKKNDIQQLQRIFESIQKMEKKAVSQSQILKKKKEKKKARLMTEAENLKRDPILTGLSPLYKDYEAKYWWFEIPKFYSTLILCGIVTLIPAEGASQVFVSLAASSVTMVLFANCNPYLHHSDDLLAQFCQLSLMLAMAIGLLEKASTSFQVSDTIVPTIARALSPVNQHDRCDANSLFANPAFNYVCLLKPC